MLYFSFQKRKNWWCDSGTRGWTGRKWAEKAAFPNGAVSLTLISLLDFITVEMEGEMETFLWLVRGQNSWRKHQVMKKDVDKATKGGEGNQGALETKVTSNPQQLNLRSAAQFCERLDLWEQITWRRFAFLPSVYAHTHFWTGVYELWHLGHWLHPVANNRGPGRGEAHLVQTSRKLSDNGFKTCFPGSK